MFKNTLNYIIYIISKKPPLTPIHIIIKIIAIIINVPVCVDSWAIDVDVDFSYNGVDSGVDSVGLSVGLSAGLSTGLSAGLSTGLSAGALQLVSFTYISTYAPVTSDLPTDRVTS